MTKEKVVFISYNTADKSVAKEIAMFLVSEGINVWFDEWKISPGDSIVEEIQKGLENCSAFILIWSKNAAESKWVRKEVESALTRAIQNNIPKIIPIKLDETDLPVFLQGIRYIKWRGGSEEDRLDIIYSITGEKPKLDYIRAIVKKYQEVVMDCDDLEKGDPLPYKVCPNCGSPRLKRKMYIDYSRDEVYFFIKCLDCGWGEWSQ